jgi:serine/threonine protein kinase
MSESDPPIEYSGRFQGAIERIPKKPEIFGVGEVLNDTYEIRDVLGRGAMAQVFQAFDLNLLRMVAIKAHHPGLDFTSLRSEARALAMLRHPAVLSVHGLGSHRNIEYLVLEYIEGITLEAHLGQRLASGERFSPVEALDFLVPVADALAAVHRGGVFHRDVKPANVMLTAGDRVVLMDFGLGQQEGELTFAGQAVGSPGYMAPEVFSRDIAETARWELVDMYAFGVMAFELLTGSIPYDGESISEIAMKHANDPVPMLPTHAGIPERLSRLVAALMAKSPQHRPTSMAQVTTQLKTIRSSIARPKTDEAMQVLVVDDDRDIARLMSLAVKQGAPMANVEVVHDAKSALAAIRRQAPQLLVLDLMMPGMTGAELYMYLRGSKLAEDTTVVAVSAGANQADVNMLLTLGVAYFLPKDTHLRGHLMNIAHETVRLARASTPAMAAVRDPST